MEENLFSNRFDAVADKLFVERWSPRSFSSDPVPEKDLKKIIDAGRWSPSTSNEQPWLFFTASREISKFSGKFPMTVLTIITYFGLFEKKL